jgi:hypothetical protein
VSAQAGNPESLRVIGGAWAARLLRPWVLPDCTLPASEVCLVEIYGRRLRVYSERIPAGWAELEARCGIDFEIAR